MWEWLEVNWLTVLAVLLALSCPLLHRWTHRGAPRERSAQKFPREL
jgi:Flp pilus assembly protein TadB